MVISVSVSTPWDQANPRTCMPSFIHFMTTLDWEISVFLLNNQTSKCQRISLAFLTRYARVMPSTYHEVIRLCFHDKKLSFMTSQVCVCVQPNQNNKGLTKQEPYMWPPSWTCIGHQCHVPEKDTNAPPPAKRHMSGVYRITLYLSWALTAYINMLNTHAVPT